MKRLFSLISLPLTVLSAYPQAESKVAYIKDADKYVVSLPKATIYQLPGSPFSTNGGLITMEM